MDMSAAALLPKFYEAINKQDLSAIAPFLADDVFYEDLAVTPEPMIGSQAVLDFFASVFKAAGPGLRFVIDDLTHHDDTRIGVLWHLENNGVVPYNKGCSFYRLDHRHGQLQIMNIIFNEKANQLLLSENSQVLKANQGFLVFLARRRSIVHQA